MVIEKNTSTITMLMREKCSDIGENAGELIFNNIKQTLLNLINPGIWDGINLLIRFSQNA